MKKMIMVLGILMIAGSVLADPIPEYTFDNSTCILTITPNGNSLNGWFVCVSENGLNIGLHNTAEELENCGHIIEITGNEIDLSEIADCSIATPNDAKTWGTLKSLYR